MNLGLNLCSNCETRKIENPDTGLCATCGHMRRKAFRNASKEKKKPKAPKKVSVHMSQQLRVYIPLRDQHLEEHPDCQVKLVGCTNRNNTVHHTAKRGKNLTNKATFLTACDYCHPFIESRMSAKERREKGLLISSPSLNRDIEKFVI